MCSFSLNIIKRVLSVGGRMQHNAILCFTYRLKGRLTTSFGYNDRRNNDIVLHSVRPFDIRVAQYLLGTMFFTNFLFNNARTPIYV